MYFLHIIEQVILPVILLIGAGAILHRSFQFEMKTFSKLLLYFYLPALTFVKIYEAKANLELLFSVFSYLLLQAAGLILLGKLISKICGHSGKMAASFSNSILLANNGNIGIPVNDLAFRHNPLAMSVQMIVVLFEILLTFTYGLFNASAAGIGLRQTLQQCLRMPVFYCFFLGLFFNLFDITMPDALWIPLHTSANGMLSFALISIGAQVARVRFSKNTWNVFLSSLVRLVVSPILAFAIIHLLQLDGVIAQALWLASAMPSSRNSAALALEYNNEPEFAAQTVLVSTIASSLTLTVVIYLSMLLFA